MNDNEFVKYLNNVEDKYDVNLWKIDNVCVWPLIKMLACEYVINQGAKATVSRKEKGYFFLSKLKKYFGMFRSTRVDAKNKDAIIYHYSVSRNIELDNKSFFDINLDPIYVLLKEDFSICSLENIGDSCKKNTFSSVSFVDPVIRRAFFFSKFFSFLYKNKIFLKDYSFFLDGIDISSLYSRLELGNILRNFYTVKYIRNYFYKILKKSNVKLVIFECGYGLDTLALCWACNDLGIKCMEIQHGIAAESGHCWYAWWSKFPLNNKKYEMLPDIFWCWTQGDKRVIDAWSHSLHTAYVGQRPIYSVLPFLYENTTYQDKFISFDSKFNVLVSLQPCVEYPFWLVEVIKETCHKFNWVIRPHPNYDFYQEKFINMLRSNDVFFYYDNYHIMLEKLLIKINAHVTNYSSVVIDSLNFGIKSIILNRNYELFFVNQIKNEDVYIGDTKASFTELLIKILNESKCHTQNNFSFSNKNKEFLYNLISSS